MSENLAQRGLHTIAVLTTWGKVRDAIAKQPKKRMLERKLEQLKVHLSAITTRYTKTWDVKRAQLMSFYNLSWPTLKVMLLAKRS